MKPISTATHGLLDYLLAAALFAMPRFLHWWSDMTTLLTVLAGAIVIYSLLTRYELGSYRVVPVRRHLLFDFVVGIALCAGPFLVDERPVVRAAVFAAGLLTLGIASFSEGKAPLERRRKHIPDRSVEAEDMDRAA